ncbi:MAG: hypothetical protein WBV91_02375 [Desulfobacterales bacterium]
MRGNIRNITEIGNLTRKVYKERVGGDPADLVRVYDKEGDYWVVRNDDTETRIAGLVVENRLEDKIAEALGSFHFIDE